MTSVEIPGLVLAIPPLLDLTATYTGKLVSKIRTYKQAKELYHADLELHNIQTGQLVICLDYVRDVTPKLRQDLTGLLHQTLSRLTKSLEVALATLERGIEKDGSIRRLWYTAYGKVALKRDLDVVGKDQELFQRAIQLATLFGGPGVAGYLTSDRLSGSRALARVQRLREAIQSRLRDDANTPNMLISEHDIPSGKKRRLPYSDIQIILSEGTGSPRAIVEYRPQNTPDTRNIRDIALILSGTDTSMAMMRCRGFRPLPAASRSELLFPIPQSSAKVSTLRELLLAPENDAGVRFSLNSRITLAQRLATAVLFIHTAKLVHKNIRPENILIFETTDNASTIAELSSTVELGDSFLMGFDLARREDEVSARAGDDKWYKNIYRHPQRQGVHPEVDFNMLHDIYSLGVVLLEIALWRSFVLIDEDAVGGPQYRENREACRFFDRKSKQLRDPLDIWKLFIRRAEVAVSPAFGNRYRDTVLMCLRCLDGGFGDPTELVDQDGVLVGLVYIERVLTTLDEIIV
jgi:serine/threonine protein kinase